MSSTPRTRRKWLVAAWPGMGQVGSIAAGFLVFKLKAKPVSELPARGFFDIEQVEIKHGVISTPRMPRNVIHRWGGGEGGGTELLLFVGEAQPSVDGHEFAHQLLDQASKLGADGVITFASVASQLHPSATPKCHGVVTQADLKADLERAGVGTLQDGQIGGLNGVLLGAAAERGLPGICLLGEIPYFGGAVANPKAARSVIASFAKLTGVPVDGSELARHDEAVDKVLLDLLERLKQQAEQSGAEIPLRKSRASLTTRRRSTSSPRRMLRRSRRSSTSPPASGSRGSSRRPGPTDPARSSSSTSWTGSASSSSTRTAFSTCSNARPDRRALRASGGFDARTRCHSRSMD